MSKYIPLVYVAGPYTAPTISGIKKNIDAAWALGFEVARLEAMPVVPHMNTAFMDGLHDQEWWLAATMELMMRCDAVIMAPGWENSRGSRGERQRAELMGIEVFESLADLKEWIDEMAVLNEYDCDDCEGCDCFTITGPETPEGTGGLSN